MCLSAQKTVRSNKMVWFKSHIHTRGIRLTLSYSLCFTHTSTELNSNYQQHWLMAMVESVCVNVLFVYFIGCERARERKAAKVRANETQPSTNTIYATQSTDLFTLNVRTRGQQNKADQYWRWYLTIHYIYIKNDPHTKKLQFRRAR